MIYEYCERKDKLLIDLDKVEKIRTFTDQNELSFTISGKHYHCVYDTSDEMNKVYKQISETLKKEKGYING